MMKRYFALAAILCFAALHATAQLTTSKLFGDHMVLQRNKPVAVWGWNKPNAKVTVLINGQSQTTKTDAQGNWKVMLTAMTEGGPYVMNISSGGKLITYNDVMIGEVWLCSGQSNMEWVLKNTDFYRAEQKIADKEPIRQFLVTKKMSLEPEKDVAGGSWIPADSSTIGDFTAVGYYFAKQLAAQLHVTVGIVHSSWGGTIAEAWTSKPALMASPDFTAYAKKQGTTWDEVKKQVETEMRAYAYNNKPEATFTAEQLANEPSSFFSDWKTGGAGAWMWQGKWGPFRGDVFMQRQVILDNARAQMPAKLQLGLTDADMSIYINGKAVVTTNIPENHIINIPAGAWKSGDNSLFIEFRSQQKNPPYFGIGINGDAKNMFLTFPDTSISLFDNKWRMMADFSKPYHLELMPNNVLSTLYNGMIAPITQLTIAGATWYQGESNAGRAHQYQEVLPMMITDWRKQWNTDFPFLIVQLPDFGPTQNSNQGSTWAELREAQAIAAKLPHTAYTVNIDAGDPNNLHPTNKTVVGTRLANAALNLVYGKPGFALSPTFANADFTNGYAMVSFNNTGNGLTVHDKYNYLKGFELAGPDHKFYYAKAEIVGNKVKVWCAEVPSPVAVRYGWSDSPVDANLYNQEGMPAAPFRSDNWKGLTDNIKYPGIN